MSRVREVTPKVLDILRKYPGVRGDDRMLLVKVYQAYGADITAPFYYIVADPDLPSFESIRRARQKIQENCEELRADKAVEDVRIAKQEEYIEYAKGDLAI